MNSTTPIAKNLVLIGGGHSHAIALKQLGMNPLSGVRLTLITNVSHTPYSGMLPGYVAGLYDFDDCHIDLYRLARFADACLVVGRAVGLDLERNQVLCEQHPPIGFDVLSIDIGSTPVNIDVPGALEYAIPVKPIAQFLQTWDQVQTSIRQHPEQPIRLGIVGGGAGGVELAFGVEGCLRRIYQAAQQPLNSLELHLFQRGHRLIPERHPWVSRQVQRLLRQRRVRLHLRENVTAIQADAQGTKQVQCESGLKIECDQVFWVTQAGAAPWLRQSGLATDERGFIQVNHYLQSLSHPHIFAAGDIATMVNHPRPKAGVFAVRQGQPLFENLQRAVQGQPLQSFTPQKQFLILIGTGDERAIASRGRFGFGPNWWLWWWKDWIDRKFMDQFAQLAPMMEDEAQPMHCAGCGAKVGSSVLRKTLSQIQQESHIHRPDVLLGLDAAEDAAVIQVASDQVLVQTVDYFPAIVQDPFIFGKITTNHCLNDLFAMGAQPQSALAIATLPYGTPEKSQQILHHLLLGVTQVLEDATAVLIGGHTTEGPELALGLTCNGLAKPEQLLCKAGLQPGQALILTKALGTGTLFAAEMQLQAKGRWIETAIQSMLQSNQAAAECLVRHQATACTDVTGFGLVGHLWEMLRASQMSAELNISAIPI
ncbi:MAG: selenide, water dikinase SelD [Microcoleaceae cyanobacterium]